MEWYWIVLISIGYILGGSLTAHYMDKLISWLDPDEVSILGVIWPLTLVVTILVSVFNLFISVLLKLDEIWDCFDEYVKRHFKK